MLMTMTLAGDNNNDDDDDDNDNNACCSTDIFMFIRLILTWNNVSDVNRMLAIKILDTLLCLFAPSQVYKDHTILYLYRWWYITCNIRPGFETCYNDIAAMRESSVASNRAVNSHTFRRN